MKYPRRQKLDMTGDPKEEYQLAPNQASVLAWLREQGEPREIRDIVLGTGVTRSSAGDACLKLENKGLVRETTGYVKPFCYEAV